MVVMGKLKFRGAQIDALRPCCRPRRSSRRAHPVELTRVELLDRRILPAVTATFANVSGLLRVVGDEQDNTIMVSRDAAGAISVNNGAIAIQGGVPTVAN